MSDFSDAELIHDAANGDVEAFGTIVKRYQTLVCSVAYAVLGDVATSEDIGQETFLSAWKQLSSLKDPTKLKSWLATTARNHARMHARKPSHQALDQTTSEPTSADKGIEEMVDRDEQQIVWATLQRLPESYREPLILYYRQEQSVAEVAEALELSTDAVKQRLARGREMLRSQVMSTIERSLIRTVPTTTFTVAVMAAVGSAKPVAAATAGTAALAGAKITATKSAGIGATGAVTGTLLGLAGGIFGASIGWLFADYASQRKLIVRQCLWYLVGVATR